MVFSSIQHVNLTMGVLTDDLKANEATMEKVEHFYGSVLGLTRDAVPEPQRHRLRWFKIGSHGQQIHCSLEKAEMVGSTAGGQLANSHPCFTVPLDQLQPLQQKLLEFSRSGHPAACQMTEGSKVGFEEVKRFFVRDFNGNRLEITAEK